MHAKEIDAPSVGEEELGRRFIDASVIAPFSVEPDGAGLRFATRRILDGWGKAHSLDERLGAWVRTVARGLNPVAPATPTGDPDDEPDRELTRGVMGD